MKKCRQHIGDTTRLKASSHQCCCPAKVPVVEVLNAGQLPISNAYLLVGSPDAPTKPLILGQCLSCGLLQLCDSFSDADLASQLPEWIVYKEPEEHLDDLAGVINQLGPQHGSKKVVALSYIDFSLAKRLESVDWKAADSFEMLNGFAEWGNTITERILFKIAQRSWSFSNRRYDLILTRHVFDHVRDVDAFATMIRSGLTEDGLVVFEVPDSTSFLETGDHLMLWENHVRYFLPETFQQTLQHLGFSVKWFHRYAQGNSAVLVAVCGKGERMEVPRGRDALALESIPSTLVGEFCNGIPTAKNELQKRMHEMKSSGGPVALMGAGHMGSLFINLYDLACSFDCVLDDDPRKVGMELPGSRLPIFPSSEIHDRDIRTIVLAINRNSEERVVERLRAKQPNLRIASIFRSSKFSILS